MNARTSVGWTDELRSDQSLWQSPEYLPKIQGTESEFTCKVQGSIGVTSLDV